MAEVRYDVNAKQHLNELTQASPEYPWDKFRTSAFCGPTRFVLQLVLVAACGSFLFGFNISLLNTAIDVVCSEFKICGERSGFATHLREAIITKGIGAGTKLCTDYQRDCSVCTPVLDGSQIINYSCPGGYSDLGCSELKWYKAFLQTAVLIGGTIGALLAGQIIRLGRRTLLLIVMFVFAVGVCCSVCSNSFPALMWARLIIGCGVGLASVASPTYMSEMTPKQERGKFCVIHQLAVTVGIFVGVLLGLPLQDPKGQYLTWSPSAFQMFWWRFMLGLGIVPVIIGTYMLWFVYKFETPIWYVENNMYKDAHSILERIYSTDDVKEELDNCIESVVKGVESKKLGLTFGKAIFDPKYRWVIFVGLGLAGFQQFGGINVFITSSADIFQKAGLSEAMQKGMSILMTAINVLMTFPTMALVEYLGRKQLLFAGSLLQFLFVLPCSISYWTEVNFENPSGITQILAIVAVLGFVTFFAVAFGPVTWVYLFEIFPLELKDVASSGCTAFNWFSGIVMVFVANVVPNHIAFTLFGVLQLLATLFILFFMKETKGLQIGVSPYIKSQKTTNSIA